ncbi:unnamed protein product [Didymodactylos carnosus]|uniref:Uncharacterized protein n=1 Tax=Didymodactylos carnosus TaxID=1234261 RepID=A0A815IUG8_9BILA|nr:unnamed protein product [Didymodactylos carnosus]CAF1431472.1 unnamed protein product [Didymodactylos carnosus]CAF4229500.1 unnamed protein product [Didymodactylos carnosus]CAF4262219.1 unnamed protein product [Didymodactylos carnosus]
MVEDEKKEPKQTENKTWIVVKSVLANEVFWGIVALLCCIFVIFVIWLVERPINWKAFLDPIHEQHAFIIIAGIFACISSSMTLYQVLDHYRHYVHKPSQKRIIRILFMVPIYALTAWFAIAFMESALYMDFAESCYEAYVIYCFVILLTKYLGGHRGVVAVICQKEKFKLVFPLCCLPPVNATPKWVWYIKWGILQYTWLAPVTTGVAVVANQVGAYDVGHWSFTNVYPYVAIIRNVSQAIALYFLVLLYTVTKDELKPFKPLPKFLAIKFIVFFVFWQSVLISGLAFIKIIKVLPCDAATNPNCKVTVTGLSIEQQKILMQNILICIEMFFFAIAHHWIFGVDSYADGSLTKLMESRYVQINDKHDEEAEAEAVDDKVPLKTFF